MANRESRHRRIFSCGCGLKPRIEHDIYGKIILVCRNCSIRSKSADNRDKAVLNWNDGKMEKF